MQMMYVQFDRVIREPPPRGELYCESVCVCKREKQGEGEGEGEGGREGGREREGERGKKRE